MNKQEGMTIVEGLRSAQMAGAAIEELQGSEARDFAFIRDEATRKELLGSFSVKIEKPFFVAIASRESGDFGLTIYEKKRGQPILASNAMSTGGVVWTYKPTKWSGDNQLRRRAFFDLAKAESVTIPLPLPDIVEFSKVINRAIELRRLADDAGGGEDEETDILEKLFPSEAERLDAARRFAATIRIAHEINPRSWCVTTPAGASMVRLNVGVVRVLDLVAGRLRLAVDGTQLDASVRAALGDALDLGERERLSSLGDSGIAVFAPSAVPEQVRAAHEALVRRAAPSITPFARHHEQAVMSALATILGETLPTPASPPKRFWKIAPGENGEMWEACRDGGFIAIGWDKLGDLTNVDHDEFKRRMQEVDASDQVWRFRNIEVGDRIVANNGTTRVLGIGTVTGSYYYAKGEKRAHRLPVRWEDTTPRVVLKKSWFKTLLPIKPEDFPALESALPVGAQPAVVVVTQDEQETLTFDGILDELRDASLSFSAELVASYMLALQAKRFVLLTGISGTGKTQLALEVARAFDEALAQPIAASDDGVFDLTAKPYHLDHARFFIPAELAQTFDTLADPEAKQLNLKVPGLEKAAMTLTRNGSVFYVRLSGEVRMWFKANIKLGDRFRLSRRSSGDSEWLELELPAADSHRHSGPIGRTFLSIAVRPSWTDKSEILGFHNPLTNKYQSTKVLEFLLRANAEVDASDGDPRPYFLIFDEMNLARVEHYFSDFLSAMESGLPIDLHDEPSIEDSQGIPRHLKIPKNLFVVGTVNIDETTYMFSPKVLDRAFVLEFNDVDFDGIGAATAAEAASSTVLALKHFERLELQNKASEQEWQAFEKILDGALITRLKRIHDTLATEHRHFGYRVAREIARFVSLAVSQTGNEAAAHDAFDVAVLSKVLPKLHGSQNELDGLLKALLSLSIDGKAEADVFVSGRVRPDLRSGISLPRSAEKLWRMLRRLMMRGFVSYIE